ncbi:MAG: enoyl-CoA hydratase/isomerase family protein [Actinobacteria bacterium]|nr:enoyl-CoA hydratase/isomerase family protein [Actinomycetota bacterium]
MEHEQIVHEEDGGVAWIRLARPDRLNALTTRMSEEILDVLGSAGRDDSVRCVVVTGQGRGFCAGQDLEEFRDAGQLDVTEHLRSGYNRMIAAIVELPKPVLGAVNGVAAGAGLSLALACDLRIASDQASFLQAFIRIGLVPDSGGTWLLPRAVGLARALEMSLTGRKVGAEEALATGLVHRVVPADRFEEEARAWAADLAALPTRAVGETKRLLAAGLDGTLSDALEREAVAQAGLAASPDFAEGVAAFLDKRAPRFTGR